jgi:long-chain acyl-CoA synthetase
VTEVASAPQQAAEPVRGQRTIGRLWRDAQAVGRRTPAYLVDTEAGWEPVSWEDAARRVDDLANGLLAAGIGKGDVVAIIGRSRLEWTLADFALALVGAVSAAIYPTSSGSECRYLLEHAEAVAALVEDEELRERVRGCGPLPNLRRLVIFSEIAELEAKGREHRAAHPDALARAEAAVNEDDPFTYIYTSGTTGPPKACVIRHRNYYDMAATVDRLEHFVTDDDVMLLWLPLAHNFGRLMSLIGPYIGFMIAFCPDPYAVGDVLPQVRPTILPSSPRLFEKVHGAVKAQFDAATGAKRRIVDWALGVGDRVGVLRRAGKPVPVRLAWQHRLADRLVYGKVKARLGGRLRFAISGAAPLGAEVAEFFHAIDILILEGYGLTECTTACSVNRLDRVKFGTVGPALPGFELRIAGDGEILIRSPTIFAGYLKDDDATREILDEDGWLHSGDVGRIDEDGFLVITDRKKDILVTAGGKNVSPQNLEAALKRAKLVSHAVVVGDGRPYVAALLTLDETEAQRWAAARGLDATGAELAADERLQAELQGAVDEVNAALARFEQIKRFAVLPRDFSIDDDELTPTLKLRRRVIGEHFAGEIDRLYH